MSVRPALPNVQAFCNFLALQDPIQTKYTMTSSVTQNAVCYLRGRQKLLRGMGPKRPQATSIQLVVGALEKS
eukprot:6175507-Pleurochrysis_carterae.AAC.1